MQLYRPISWLAVASCLLGLTSFVALFRFELAVIPALGVVCGSLGMWRIHRRRDELAGENLAAIGLVLCLLAWVGGWSWLSYVYLTEVPGDAQRITFNELQPDLGEENVVPAAAKALDGERVFIKGFMYPGAHTRGIKEFVLCFNSDDCCFGGSPKLTHMIFVRLNPPLTVDYKDRYREYKIAGKFRVGASGPVDGLTGAIYNIDADFVQ